MDNAKDLFAKTRHRYGIYRDDGIIFFKGNWTNKKLDGSKHCNSG